MSKQKQCRGIFSDCISHPMKSQYPESRECQEWWGLRALSSTTCYQMEGGWLKCAKLSCDPLECCSERWAVLVCFFSLLWFIFGTSHNRNFLWDQIYEDYTIIVKYKVYPHLTRTHLSGFKLITKDMLTVSEITTQGERLHNSACHQWNTGSVLKGDIGQVCLI